MLMHGCEPDNIVIFVLIHFASIEQDNATYTTIGQKGSNQTLANIA